MSRPSFPTENIFSNFEHKDKLKNQVSQVYIFIEYSRVYLK